LDDLITLGRDDFTYGANSHDRELIDGRWQPIFSNPRAASGDRILWDGNDYPQDHNPAAYLMNGIRFVIPHRHSSWREDDPKTYDHIPH
jgi:hypothetical protein